MPSDQLSDSTMVELLDTVWRSTAALGAGLDEEQWKRPTEVPGWSVQDNLTHVTALEWRLLGRPEPEHAVAGDLPHIKNDFGRSNEVFVDSRRTLTGQQALDEFVEVTGARLAQLRSFGPDDFGADSFTPVGPGTVRDLLPFRIFDSWVHEQDMRRAAGVPGHLDGPVADASFERVVGAMPFVVGKKAGSPDGATVVFDLSAPLPRAFAIGVEGGRAKRLDAVPAGPTVTITGDGETFVRVACGRVEPADALAAGHLRVTGDEALGRKIVESLNFLI
jgi:uncharacterized protein (TIGR03083 family)